MLAKEGNLLYIARTFVSFDIHEVLTFMKVVLAYVIPALPVKAIEK